MVVYKFGTASKKAYRQLHPLLQKLADEMIKEIDFRILDAVRGKAAQEYAFKQKKSKAHFGQSAHNYVPAVAMDLFPAPYDWDDEAAFDRMGKVGLAAAKRLGIPVRWGGDWHMDGSKTTDDSWDKPHFELHPWRKYATSLYKG